MLHFIHLFIHLFPHDMAHSLTQRQLKHTSATDCSLKKRTRSTNQTQEPTQTIVVDGLSRKTALFTLG